MENTAMNFEKVIESLLFNQPNQMQIYYAGVYTNDLRGARALLYSTCIKERDFNFNNYSQEERDLLEKFIENLLLELDSNDITLVKECISLLHSKL